MGARRKKLLTAARLWWFDKPRFGRSCEDCRKYVYDERGDTVLDNTPARKRLPLLMAPGVDPPCHMCGKTVGLAVRHYSGVADATPLAYRTLRHYRACRAVNWQVPEAADRIVRRNALLIRTVEDAAEAGRSSDDLGRMVVELLRLTRR